MHPYALKSGRHASMRIVKEALIPLKKYSSIELTIFNDPLFLEEKRTCFDVMLIKLFNMVLQNGRMNENVA